MAMDKGARCPFSDIDRRLSSVSRKDALHAHFCGKHLPAEERIVCPWGIEAALRDDIVYAEMPRDSGEWHQAMFQAIRTYRSDRKAALVIVAPEDLETHEASRLFASQLFLELSCAFEHADNTREPLSQIKARYEIMLQRLLLNPKARIVAGTIKTRGGMKESQNVVAMGPLFARPHARYAPHLCLVSIRYGDIIEAGGGEELTNIKALRARQQREHERLRELGAIRVIDEGGEVIILDNEFYPTTYLQISETRYALRLRVLEAQEDRGLIEE